MSQSLYQLIKQRIEETLKNDPKFTDFDLSSIPIQKFTPEINSHLQKFPKIQVLYLVHCGLQTLSPMPTLNLMAIDLSHNLLDDNSNIKSLTLYFPNLQQILLNHNKIANLGTISELCQLKNLSEIDFRNNPVLGQNGHGVEAESIIQALFRRYKKLQIINCRNREGEFCAEADIDSNQPEQEEAQAEEDGYADSNQSDDGSGQDIPSCSEENQSEEKDKQLRNTRKRRANK